MIERLTALLGAEWRVVAAPWCRQWGVPGLEDRIALTISRRLRSSLGRCTPMRGDIRIAAFLMEAPADLVREVLCHEIAHVAVAELHGRSARPHGKEWRGLMRLAGFSPRARLDIDGLGSWSERRRRARPTWEHHCPACGMRARAGRPVTQWRCAACCKAGRHGKLVITRMPANP